MQRLDSLKFVFSNELALSIPENFNKKIDIIDEIEHVSYSLKPKLTRTGIKGIYRNNNNFVVEVSSKLIPGEYYNMMNINNIERYFDVINNSGLIQFDTKTIIENSHVLSCDTTNNIPGIENVATYINPLQIYKVNDKFVCKLYKNESIIFHKNVKILKTGEHLKLYDKFKELGKSKKKEDEQFLNNIDIEKFRNVLRIESRFNSLKLMRKYFNVSDTTLLNILNSNENVNLNIFNRITDINNIDTETFTNYKSLVQMRENKITRASIEKKAGMIQIIKMLNNDIGLIRMFINTGSTANNSAKIKEYKSLIKSINDVENNSSIDERVNEIKEYLKVA